MAKIEQILHEISGGDVLDVGTGCGPNIREIETLLKDYRTIIGVDTQMSRLIEATTEKFPDHSRIHFACMDAYRLALPDSSFDTVMISNSLHHLDRPREVLREIARVTRPGGYVFVFEMYCDNLTALQMSHVMLHHWWAAIDRRAGIVHNETFTRDEILQMCADVGLKVEQVCELPDPPGEPIEPEMMSELEKLIDTYPDKISDHPDRERLVSEGAQIKERLHDVGIAWATQLCVFARN